MRGTAVCLLFDCVCVSVAVEYAISGPAMVLALLLTTPSLLSPHTGTVPLVSVSPAPADNDFLFHLEDLEGLAQLYDMADHTHTQLTHTKSNFFEVTP